VLYIDIVEVMHGHNMHGQPPMQAMMSTSLQLAPGIPDSIRPKNGQPLDNSSTWYGFKS
jgi:hypothetical protein